MALANKLQEEKSMSELLEETKELNQLMTSYIRVQMNKETAKDLTIQSQLDQIRENSNEVIQNMQSILDRQEQIIEKSKKALQEVLTDGQKQMQENNNQTISKLSELEERNTSQLNNINQ